MSPGRSWPLKWHLGALALAALAPALCFSAWLLFDSLREESRHIEDGALALAESRAQSLDQMVTGLISTLRALKTSNNLSTGDYYAAFGNQTARSFEKTGVRVAVRDANFALLGPPDIVENIKPDEALSPAVIKALASATGPVFGSFQSASRIGPSGADIWMLAKPPGAQPLVLQARVPAEQLLSILRKPQENSPWSITLTDAQGQVLATTLRSQESSLNIEASTGTAYASTVNEGVIRSKNDAGEAIIQATAHVPVAGWIITAAAPRARIEKRIDDRLEVFLVVAALLGSLMAGATTYLAGSISRSISKLSANARGLAIEEKPVPFDTTIREVHDLMDSIRDTGEELQRRKAALRETDHRLRMALDAGGMGVWEWDRATDVMKWDPVLYDLTGMPRGERAPRGEEFLKQIVPEDRERVDQAMSNLSPDDPAFAVDFRFRRMDGAVRWFSGRGLLLANESGQTQGIIGVNFDLTDQKLNVERTALLLREVSHRSKNMLALILAMARLTARDATNVQTHVKNFSARVSGIAASQDLIVEADWQSVDLAELAQAELQAIGRDSAERVKVSGPAVLVRPDAAQTLGMVFAELTLNAMQHGALSTAKGSIDLTWEIIADTLHMTWRESDGPPCSAAAAEMTTGYGTAVIERFASQGLKVITRVSHGPDGFTWTLTGPVENIGHRAPRS